MSFRGTFDHTLDAKNRLTIPARFRPAFSAGVVLALSSGPEPCAEIWRPEDFEAFTAQALAGLHPLSERARKLDRFFSAHAWDTELDGAGRVMLPPKLMERAGIFREVVVAGRRDRLEVWPREGFEDYSEGVFAELPELISRFDEGE